MADNAQVLFAVSLGLILSALFIIFVHNTMPGRIARKRGNPQAEANLKLRDAEVLVTKKVMAAQKLDINRDRVNDI